MKQRETTIPRDAVKRFIQSLDRLIELNKVLDKQAEVIKYRELRRQYPVALLK